MTYYALVDYFSMAWSKCLYSQNYASGVIDLDYDYQQVRIEPCSDLADLGYDSDLDHHNVSRDCKNINKPSYVVQKNIRHIPFDNQINSDTDKIQKRDDNEKQHTALKTNCAAHTANQINSDTDTQNYHKIDSDDDSASDSGHWESDEDEDNDNYCGDDNTDSSSEDDDYENSDNEDKSSENITYNTEFNYLKCR